MTQPNFTEYRTLSTNQDGVVPELLRERWLTCLAVFISGQNPDGTTYVA